MVLATRGRKENNKKKCYSVGVDAEVDQDPTTELGIPSERTIERFNCKKLNKDVINGWRKFIDDEEGKI